MLRQSLSAHAARATLRSHRRLRGKVSLSLRESFKLSDVVAAKHGHRAVAQCKLAKPRLILQARSAVLFEHPLVETQTRRAMRFSVHFRVVEIGVGGIEEPAVPVRVHGDSHMSERMASQWNDQQIGRQSVESLNALETIPCLADIRQVDPPVVGSRPLLWTKPLPVHPRSLLERIVAFPAHQVHRCVREVVETTGMVEVQMAQHDMADIARIESEPFN